MPYLPQLAFDELVLLVLLLLLVVVTTNLAEVASRSLREVRRRLIWKILIYWRNICLRMVLQSVHEILANVDITMLEVDQLLLFGEGWRRSPIVVQLFGSSAALVTMLVLRDEALMLELFVIVNLTFNRRK